MSERKGLIKGKGARKDITSKMQSTVGVLLGGIHPVMLTAKATWMGTVNSLIATDLQGRRAVLPLHFPFTPLKERSIEPRKLKLKLSSHPDVDNGVDRHIVSIKFEDSETLQVRERVLYSYIFLFPIFFMIKKGRG